MEPSDKTLAGIRARDGMGNVLALTLQLGEPPWQGSGEGADDLATALSCLFPARRISPADGTPGAQQANAAAQWLKEKVGLEILGVQLNSEPGPEGAIY